MKTNNTLPMTPNDLHLQRVTSSCSIHPPIPLYTIYIFPVHDTFTHYLPTTRLALLLVLFSSTNNGPCNPTNPLLRHHHQCCTKHSPRKFWSNHLLETPDPK